MSRTIVKRTKIVIVVIALTALAGSLIGLSVNHRINSRLEAIRQSGQPVTIDEYRSQSQGQESDATRLWNHGLSLLDDEIMQLTQQQQDRILDVFLKASAGRGIGERHSEFASFCQLKAKLAADNTDFATVCDCVDVLLARGRALRRSTNRLSQSSANTLDSVAFEILRQYLYELPDDRLLRIRERVIELDYRNDLRNTLYLDRIEALPMFLDRDQAMQMFEAHNVWSSEDEVSDIDKAKWYLTRNDDLVFYLDAMARFIEITDEDLPRIADRARDIHNELHDQAIPLLSSIQLKTRPLFYFGWFRRAVAEQRMVLGGINGEMFRRRTGELPRSLADLNMKQSQDPYDGKPIRFRASKGSFTLYCVGPNRRDDDGRYGEYITSSARWETNADDVAFRFGGTR